MTEKELLWNKVKTLYNGLRRQKSWYTGLSIKRYLKSNIFSLQTPKFTNSSIDSGRWSAYCHYSQIKSFENLLKKNQIGYASPIIVHPLLPESLISVLEAQGAEIIFLDIQKNTQNLVKEQILDVIQKREHNRPVELVLHYGFNGLYEEIIETIQEVQKRVIPSLVVIENPDPNISLLNLFEALTFGGVLWNFGDSFWDDHLNKVMDLPLATSPWYISWNTESRTKSLLEYHLSESHQLVLPMMEAYFFLLLYEYKKVDLFGNFYAFMGKNFWFRGRFKDRGEALDLIKTTYPELFEIALPDLIFDLQTNSPEKFVDFGKPAKLIERSSLIQSKAKDLYDFFMQKLPTRPAGTLEISDFFLDRNYLKYFIYTTEPKFWQAEILKYGFFSELFPRLSPSVRNNPSLVNAKTVADFCLIIDVWSGVESQSRGNG